MKRLITLAALLAASTVLPGCVFAVGSKHESQPADRLDRLERRISEMETKLGIQPPAADAAPESQP